MRTNAIHPGTAVCLLLTLITAPAALAVSYEAGLSAPSSGALNKYWDTGATLAVRWRQDRGRVLQQIQCLRYIYFDYDNPPDGIGYGTHGASGSYGFQWSSIRGSGPHARLAAGLAGLWTTDARLSASIADASFRPPIGKIHGWGPSLEGGIGYRVHNYAGHALGLAAAYRRSWASDGYLDVAWLAFEVEF